MKYIKILIIMLTLLVSSSAAFSAGSLSVVLSSQNPDPVSAGNFVYLNVKVSNSVTNSGDNVILNFVENNFFKLAPGEDISKNLGVIPAYSSSLNSNNFVIAKFKVLVKDNAPVGLNTVKFNLVSGVQEYNYEFNVLVQNKNPSLTISSLNIKPISAGSSEKLVLEIENTNSMILKNIIVSLALDRVTPTNSLSIISGSNQKTIAQIMPNEKIKLEFDVAASPDSLSVPYLLPIDISYEDSLSNNFSKRILSSIKVFSKPILALKLSSQEIYTKGKGKINLAIANPGTSTIKGTRVEILPSKNYDVLNGGFEYIGNLNPDDFQTIQSQIYFKSDKDFNLKVKLNYLDSYNNKNEKIIEIPIKIYSDNQLKDLGLAAQSSGSSSMTKTITSLVLIIISFFIGRRLGFNKAKKLRK